MVDIAYPWERTEPLRDALFGLRMRGAFYSWTEASGDVAVTMPQFPSTLSFHIVAEGVAHLEVDGHEPRRLVAGQLALIPRGIGHRVSSRVGARVLGRADLLPQTMRGDAFSVLRIGPESEPVTLTLLCGVVGFDAAGTDDMLAVLPSMVLVDSRRHPVIADLLPLLMGELRDPRPGGDVVATRLADVLVVEAVRAWLADDPAAASGWLAALRDPQLGVAIAALHRDPGHRWSLGELAQTAMMSRSAFAQRFSEVVGVPTMSYLAQARMRSARERLAGGDRVAEVAAAFGYGSEAAFSRAFLRVTGQTPGSVRKRTGVNARVGAR